jgi:ABC-2 type transport system ATP-binding protein
VIECRKVVKRFGTFQALDHVSFDVGKERVVGFLGLNGAGKTTTLRILSCFTPPTAGEIRIAGFDTVRQADEVRQRIGYLPERVPLYDDMRVQEYLRFRARIKGVKGSALHDALDRVMSRCGLLERKRSPIGTLSKGFRQRVGIADALVHDPELLLLDEPTSGLDPDQRLELRKLIREQASERTVLLSTHILSEAEAACDDVIIIHAGRIKASGVMSDFKNSDHDPFRIRFSGPSVPGIKSTPSLDGKTSTIHCASQSQASSMVERLVHGGCSILELLNEAPTLEQTFIRLTTGREESL